ncbi:MAG: PAS domain-containing protein [Oscillospiraceae bacterium]|nr:PAS domain-containing protein [Oscillospiraceae bacterium]
MGERLELFHESIIRDMSEGVMTIGFDGVIAYVNAAALAILDRRAEDLVGERYDSCFFRYGENDALNRTILAAVYDTTSTHKSVVPYFTGTETRQLNVMTSFLHKGEEKIGVVVVLNDITELADLRDAVSAMGRIKELNGRLELRNQLLEETFGRFLSDEIVDQLLETPDGLAMGGKKRSITVMMSDLRGFTAMSERMDAQKLIAMLNHYLGEMIEIIQRYNGTIIEFLGDGILTVFGAPEERDSHAADAVAAAIAMQSRMAEVNRWNEEGGYPDLEMGIGISSGEAIVGNIGSEKRTKYGVVGSMVNLCGRIESYTVGGQVFISPRTREMIGAELTVAQELEILPKGVKAPLTISHVTAIGAPYDVSCERKFVLAQPIERPLPVRFVIVEGKHCSDTEEYGEFVALSERGAYMKTATQFSRFDNLRIEAGGTLLAKVLSQTEDGSWLLRFTSVPPDFFAWCRGAAEN